MSTNEQKINLSEYNQGEKIDAVNIKAVSGKEININGFRHTRGKPTKYTRPDQIGDDGKTDFYTVTTQEEFELEHQGEIKPIHGFFVTEGISNQINRVENVQDAFATGKVIGPCKAIKRKSDKTGNDYWCLVFPNEEDYPK